MSMSRWTEKDREWFSIFVNGPATNPSVAIHWTSEGVARSAQLNIVPSSYGYIEGWIPGNFVGDFRVNSISITTDEGSTEAELDPGESFKDDAEMLEVDHGDQPESFFEATSYSTAIRFTALATRILDRGGSGLPLSRDISAGWALPGILDPQITTMERLQEALAQPYSDTKGNEVYIVDGTVYFLRSTPAGSDLVSAPINDVYTFRVNDPWNGVEAPISSLGLRPTQVIFESKNEVGKADIPYWDLPDPNFREWGDELEAIFTECIHNREGEAVWIGYPVIQQPATQAGPDRLAGERFSTIW